MNIPLLKGYKGISTLANFAEGQQVAIVAGNINDMAAAWKKLMPNVPFNPDIHQHVIILSPNEPILNPQPKQKNHDR